MQNVILTSCCSISTERFVGSFGSQANFTCPIGHFMTEHTDVTEVLHSVLMWEDETTIVATTLWIVLIALETAAYSDGARLLPHAFCSLCRSLIPALGRRVLKSSQNRRKPR
jgi:hypothetical protein